MDFGELHDDILDDSSGSAKGKTKQANGRTWQKDFVMRYGRREFVKPSVLVPMLFSKRAERGSRP